ncbi:acetate kinase, partial [Aliarcobacter butzleri]
AIGLRVAHGGEYFKESSLVTEKVIKKIEEAIPLAPLHNPANILGMKICMQLFPKVPNVAVSDTAFPQTMPEIHFLFP